MLPDPTAVRVVQLGLFTLCLLTMLHTWISACGIEKEHPIDTISCSCEWQNLEIFDQLLEFWRAV